MQGRTDTLRQGRDASAPAVHLPRARVLRDAIESVPVTLLDRLPGGAQRFLKRCEASARATGQDEIATALRAHAEGRDLSLEALRIVTLAQARVGDTEGLSKALARFDPGIAPLDPRLSFVGKGNGLETLNIYLRQRRNGATRFGKIYVAGSAAEQRMRFALGHVLPRLAPIPHARLRAAETGSRLTLAWFDFLSIGVAAPAEGPWKAAIGMAKTFAAGTRIENGAREWQGIPVPQAAILPERHIAIRGARALNAHAGPALARVVNRCLRRARGGPLVFSHGDIHRRNLTGDGAALDWDASGFQPVGYDAACAVHAFTRPADLGVLDALRVQSFQPPDELRSSHARAQFLMFFAVAMMGRPGRLLNLALINAVLAELAAAEQEN